MTRYFDLGRPRRRPRPAPPKEEQIFHEPPPVRASEPKRPSRGRRNETGLYYLGLVALLLFLVALYTSQGSTPPSPVPTPALQTNKDQIPRLLTPTVLVTPSLTPTPSAVPADKATPDAEKQKILLRVINGSRKPERLTTATDALTKAGFKVDSTGTAVNFYNATVIYYKAGKLKEAQLVQTTAKEVLQSTLQQSSIVGNNDVLVVVGVK